MSRASSSVDGRQAVETEIRALDGLDLKSLRAAWPARFGPPPKLRSVELLSMLLAWHLQTEALSSLSADTKRLIARRGPVEPEGRAHGIGTILRRTWEDRQVEAIVEADGFRFDGELYGRGGKIYRYYVSAPLQCVGKKTPADTLPRRVSANAIESYLAVRFAELCPVSSNQRQPTQPLSIISRTEIYADHLVVMLPTKWQPTIEPHLGLGEAAVPDHSDPKNLRLTLLFRVSTKRGKTELIAGEKSGSSLNQAMIRAAPGPRAAGARQRRRADHHHASDVYLSAAPDPSGFSGPKYSGSDPRRTPARRSYSPRSHGR